MSMKLDSLFSCVIAGAASLMVACADEPASPDDGADDDRLADVAQAVAGAGAVDFGGAYGWVNNGTRVMNPFTAAQSCPSGFTATQLLGTSGVDWSAYICTRPRVTGVAPIADFGGMWGYVNKVKKPNPATGDTTCPAGFTDQTVLDNSGVDYPLHVCYKPHVAGTEPLYELGGAWGYINGGALSANPATGGASCPSGFVKTQVLGTYNVDYSTFMCMTFQPDLDFGGAFGYVNAAPVKNPATSAESCPSGYSATQILGTNNVDYPVRVCTRPHQPGAETRYDWGGMWGYVGGRVVPNWITGKPSCPAGYSDLKVLGMNNVDYDLHVCYRSHVAGTRPAYAFAGLWGAVDGVETVNPATGAPTCPAGYGPEQALGTYNVDYSVKYCAPIYSSCEAQGAPCGSLAEQYAPKVWLNTGEKYMPSSTELFLANVHEESISGTSYLVTNQPLGCDSCTDPIFLDGTSPAATTVPVYAEIVNRTQSGQPTNVTDVIYWMFYPYNNGKRVCIGLYSDLFGCIGGYSTFGNHVGDWEHVTIRFVDGAPTQVALSQHSGGAVFAYGDPRLALRDGRPVVYAAKGSHGLYPDAARHIYATIPNGDFLADDTDAGTQWQTSAQVVTFDPQDAPFGAPLSWLSYTGRWGNAASGCSFSWLTQGECVLNPGPASILPRPVSSPELRPIE